MMLLLGSGGCVTWEEPIMLGGKPNPIESPDVIQHYKDNSDFLAECGWSRLSEYQADNSWILHLYLLKDAAINFNSCWRWNPDNYNAYWGWGIVRGIQATLPDFEDSAELFLKQSITFLLDARKHDFPETEIDAFRLDLANAYNGLGAFYLDHGQPEKADTPLAQGEALLLDVIKTDSDNGRAYFLLSANAYYRGNIKIAKEYVIKAKNLNYKIPVDFIDQLK